MHELGKTVIKKVAGREVICRELSVAQVRNLLEAPSIADVVSEALFESIRLVDLPTWTNLQTSDVDDLLPSQVAVIVEGCREANPHFFEMLARLTPARGTP